MIDFELKRYKQSVSKLRQALGVGVPENRDGDVVEVKSESNNYRFKVQDLYLTHFKLDTESDWTEITRHNYSQMGITDEFEISGSKIQRAFSVSKPTGTNLALVIIATSEAIRSQVVYQTVQQMLSRPQIKLTWAKLKPLLVGSWIYNIEENNKCRPIKYGALGPQDYYNDKAKVAIKDIRNTGFQID